MYMYLNKNEHTFSSGKTSPLPCSCFNFKKVHLSWQKAKSVCIQSKEQKKNSFPENVKSSLELIV